MANEKLADKELIKRILEGDAQVFKLLISNTQGLVLQIIYKMISNPEDRKDLTQEVYLKIYAKLASFKFKSKLSTWIGAICYNTCLNFLEKKNIPILNVVDEDGKEAWETIEAKTYGSFDNQTERYIFRKDRAQILANEIEKLPPLYKTLITLFHQEELSYKEIAKITSLPEGTLKNYLYRARKQLKKNLLVNYKKEDL